MSRTDWFCQQALGAKRKGSRVSLPCQLGGREMTQLWGGLSSVPAAPATGMLLLLFTQPNPAFYKAFCKWLCTI